MSRHGALPSMLAPPPAFQNAKTIRSPRKAPRMGSIRGAGGCGPVQGWSEASPDSVTRQSMFALGRSRRCPGRPNSPAVDDDLSVESVQSADDCFEPRDSPETIRDFDRAPKDLPRIALDRRSGAPKNASPRSLLFRAVSIANEEPRRGSPPGSPTASRAFKVAPAPLAPLPVMRTPTPRHHR
ncbi:hypothetical protein AURANDRAFT_69151 [Aureococcus anophagefferens]|uniref:Uncharacterized protein n=1 Tax=Aureococcus anophagefferens TaxID=44056 RepID=F0YRW0_AURAN|nr:hypothetical protein AURANDRAFT_69151 [Aureococcus anophagefferens]EGB02149.1 hypothetical protein AURANDRAFT_69151 [Aureococcus anophagefferens]|eukprot:XP_009043152.1 hypothetical protein AURANDRAFT_69151 [Aureococcus anophagefferens]